MKKQAYCMVLSLLIGLFLLAGCGKPVPQESQSPLVQQPDVVQISPEAEKANGIQLITVGQRTCQNHLTTIGQVRADENRVFHISSLEAGRVVQDRVVLGEVVRTGQVLALIQNSGLIKIQADSIHALHDNEIGIAQAKTKLSLARQNLAREQKLFEQGVSPRKDLLQASAEVKLAQTELAGLQEHHMHIQSEAKALLDTYNVQFNPNSERLQTGSPLKAPRGGLVTKKSITVGDTVTPDQILYEVADLSQVWLDLTIYANEVANIKLGSIITFQSDSLPGKVFRGRINYSQPGASQQSHTFLVRAFLDNPAYLLKPGMFGEATINQSHSELLPFLPKAALQTYGKENFVFIPIASGRYRKQTIVLGDSVNDGYMIKKGLTAGQQVVGAGSFILKAEMLKNEFEEEE